jgi:N-acyl-D-amino-acid deacylase
MTQLPASTFGLGDRGVVRPGAIADLAVFDPMTVDDRASYAQPRALAAGVHLVFVAGRIAWEHGHRQGADVGQVLNRSR